MKTIKVESASDYLSAALEAVEVLKEGGVVVYPTDTVYGLGTNACEDKAVEQIYKIKKRMSNNPLPILVRDMKWAKEIALIPTKLEKILTNVWPGAVTVILPGRGVISKLANGGSTVALRIAKHPLVDMILSKFGYPLTGTSANISTKGGADDPELIMAAFRNQIWQPDLVIDAGRMASNTPSTIIDFSEIKPKIVRQGAVSRQVLMELLGILGDKVS